LRTIAKSGSTFAALLLAAWACKSTEPQANPSTSSLHAASNGSGLLLDVNDVSVLFPIEKGSLNSDFEIPISPKLDVSTFVSQSLLNEVMEAGRSKGTVQDVGVPIAFDVPELRDLKNWRVVGFRFDPCAPTAALATEDVPSIMKPRVPGCIVQLRLITQPINRFRAEDGSMLKLPPFFADMTMHLVYNLGVVKKSASDSELKANFAPFMPLISGLQKIKALSSSSKTATDGAPLGVHPGLRSEMGRGRSEQAQEVARYLSSFAGLPKLSSIAFMGTDSNASAPLKWIFIAGAVTKDASGNAHFTQIPNLAFRSKTVMAIQKERSDNAPSSDGIRPSPEDLTRSVAPFVSLNALTERVSPTATDGRAVVEVDHPERSHVFNVDCVSCHMSGVVIRGADLKASDMPGRYIPPIGITGYLAKDVDRDSDLADGLVFRNFGYFDTRPTIGTRTVNETSSVAYLSNRIISGGNPKNPGLNCGSDRSTLDDIWDCSVNSSFGKDCFASCSIVGQK
jgi:hypothetical protein